MRWKTDKTVKGSKRFVERYAFVPTKLDDGYTVWLENYWEVQTWDDGTTSTGYGYWKKAKLVQHIPMIQALAHL
jgi:hypothetical protein